jgi:hypothetical protein
VLLVAARRWVLAGNTLSFDVVVLISIGVDLGRGLGFYREEETPERKNTINIHASMRKQA